MIKVTFALRRRPSLSRQDFQRYWREEHAPLVVQHAKTLGVSRYVQNHTVNTSASSALATARGAPIDHFDGVAELWWESLDDLTAGTSIAAGRDAARALLRDERSFIDLPSSPIITAVEYEVDL